LIINEQISIVIMAEPTRPAGGRAIATLNLIPGTNAIIVQSMASKGRNAPGMNIR